ncbi:MAG: rod shape-determining protein MreC [Bacteroidetes bacterium]|jgi:rod shape-determining protein MreC|nr:rod shape-determining protein MreC [Bacteroidota bacterium]
MLQRLIDLLHAFRDLVVLGACIVVSVLLLAANDNPQVKRIRSVAAVLLGTVQEPFRSVTAYFDLRTQNDILRRINVELSDEATQLREARLENARLRRLLELPHRIPYRLIAAEVVGKSVNLQRNTLVLNIGRLDGVEPLMPVINDQGLVGVVTDVSDRYAVVNILLNTEFRATGKVQRTRVDGIVGWDGNVVTFRNVARTMDVQVGDVVLTSEYSNTFPPDIRIGVVSLVEERPGSLFKSVTLTPGVDFVRLEEVFVVDAQPAEERTGLERRGAR